MTDREIVITLIKDHLINTRLINGLSALSLYSQDYYLHFSDLIFKLMGISDEREELYEVYMDWCTKRSQTEIFKNETLLEEYANEIYCVLLGEVGE